MPLTNTLKRNAFDFLCETMNWIESHLEPGEVFGVVKLKRWAGDNCEPADVFEQDDLAQWAERNGYVKAE